MFNVESSMIDSLTLSIPHPDQEGRVVSITISRPNKRRNLTLVNCEELEEVKSGKRSKACTYCSSIDMDAKFKDKNHIVINDNKEIVGKYVIYCGASARRSYVTQDGEILPIRSGLFYYEHYYGEGIKSEDYFQSQMIKHKCYFDTFEQALNFIQGLAKNPDADMFKKDL